MNRENPTPWRKSSHSGEEANCVEVAADTGAVHLRDSKNPETPPLRLAPAAWRSLLKHI